MMVVMMMKKKEEEEEVRNVEDYGVGYMRQLVVVNFRSREVGPTHPHSVTNYLTPPARNANLANMKETQRARKAKVCINRVVGTTIVLWLQKFGSLNRSVLLLSITLICLWTSHPWHCLGRPREKEVNGFIEGQYIPYGSLVKQFMQFKRGSEVDLPSQLVNILISVSVIYERITTTKIGLNERDEEKVRQFPKKRDFKEPLESSLENLKYLFHRNHPNITQNSSENNVTRMNRSFGIDVESGLPIGTPEYLVRIGIGTPPQYQYLAIDTGSDVTWVQCRPCDHCYPQRNPIFNATASSTARPLPCKTLACNMLGNKGHCIKGQCQYKAKYMDKSYTHGQYAFESFTSGDSTIPNVAVGLGHKNKGTFSEFSGILGLGGGFSFRNQLGAALPISFCLPHPNTASIGWLEIGDISGTVQWISIQHTPKFPDKKLDIPQIIFQLTGDGEGGVIVDTGTVITRFPNIAYEALRDSFLKETNYVRAPPKSGFDTCFTVPQFQSLDLPTISLYFTEGLVLDIRSDSVLIQVDDEKMINGARILICMLVVTMDVVAGIVGIRAEIA
ncbi:unnamed protein product [Dovyalis caffra]|uniref:Peptidase A1 domain-containing protein n=1 Tax=Dovyalis caffra TaxID=77055 RepID=A0AAV1RT05_9ROSI|nr:unnamed protein product [Dovyalis caffra]